MLPDLLTELVFNSADGTFSYTPDANYNGSDSFTYKVSDGTLDSPIQTVNFNIVAVNDAPVANPLVVNAEENAKVSGTVSWTDVDSGSATVIIVNGPSHGIVNMNNDGTFTYTPDPNYVGNDSFSFVVNDGISSSAQQVVQVYIVASNPTVQTSAPHPLLAALFLMEPKSPWKDFRFISGTL